MGFPQKTLIDCLKEQEERLLDFTKHVLKGTLVQIWKSAIIFVVIWK